MMMADHDAPLPPDDTDPPTMTYTYLANAVRDQAWAEALKARRDRQTAQFQQFAHYVAWALVGSIMVAVVVLVWVSIIQIMRTWGNLA